METLIMPRAVGKTIHLIRESATTGHTIVCANHLEAQGVLGFARKMHLSIPHPITYEDFLKQKYKGKDISGFLIDNADYLLQSLTKIPIKTITVNPSELKKRFQ